MSDCRMHQIVNEGGYWECVHCCDRFAPAALNADLLAALKDGERSLNHYLEDVKYRQTGRDPKTNGYTYIEMPEWAARQLLDTWGPAIKAAEKQSAGEQS